MITDHGIFELYEPEDRGSAPPGAGFCRNAAGTDWYALQKSLDPGAALVEVDPETGRVLGKTGAGGTHDYSTRWPLDKRLLEIRPASDADGLTTDMRFNGVDFEPVPPPQRDALYKTDIYSRMSDDELEAFTAGIEQADTRTRLMWRDCLEVQVASPLWPLLQQQISTAFGADRAAAILSLDPQ